jgi:hypothetical protein
LKNTVRIEKNTLASPEVWKEIYESCDYATYFHSPEFSNSIKIIQPKTKIGTRLIEFNDNKRALLLLHQELSFKGLLTFNNSLSFSGYGGWISGDELGTTHTDLLLEYIKKLNIYIRINPFDTSNAYKKLRTDADYAHILDLRRDYAIIHKNYNRNRKRDIVNAEKNGVTFSGAASAADWKEFYEIYLKALAKWGDNARNKRPWPFWETLMKSNPDNVKLYTVNYDSKIIAGVVCLSGKRKITEYYRVFLDDYKHLTPVSFLIDQVIQRSIGQYDYFDFMSSGKVDHIIAFKSGFGPELVANDTFTNYTLKFRLLQNILKLTRKVFL